MSKKEKLARRLRSRPKDFTFDELTTLLKSLGYSMETAGKTSGSRVTFEDESGDYIRLHKPHPHNILKMYQIDDIIGKRNGKRSECRDRACSGMTDHAATEGVNTPPNPWFALAAESRL